MRLFAFDRFDLHSHSMLPVFPAVKIPYQTTSVLQSHFTGYDEWDGFRVTLDKSGSISKETLQIWDNKFNIATLEHSFAQRHRCGQADGA